MRLILGLPGTPGALLTLLKAAEAAGVKVAVIEPGEALQGPPDPVAPDFLTAPVEPREQPRYPIPTRLLRKPKR